MAIIYSPLFGDISGKCGGVMFRKQYGQTIMQTCPGHRHKKTTPKQKAHENEFADVVLEARKIIHNKTKRAEWEAKCPPDKSQTLFNRIIKQMYLENNTNEQSSS